MRDSEKNTENPWWIKASGKKPKTQKNSKSSHDKKEEKKFSKSEKFGGKAEKSDLDRKNTRKAKNPDSKKSFGTKYPCSHLFDASVISKESLEVLNNFDQVISSVLNLSSKQQVTLGGEIKKLSHELTDDRGSRRLGYMNNNSALAAYINYFMWWNLVRLTRLFANLPANTFDLQDGDTALDIGSGPLTVVIALWLARPELRSKKITWYCMDLSQGALSAGEELFLSVAAKTSAENQEPWQIVRIKGSLGTSVKKSPRLITSANVFNEVIQSRQSENPTASDFLAKKYQREIENYFSAEEKNPQTIIMIEPGDPHSARFVSLMRDSFLRRGFMPVAPCPHARECPMDGRDAKKGGKWCNFAFSTEDAPKGLLKLSEKSGLAKERAGLSFVVCKRKSGQAESIKIEEREDLHELSEQKTLKIRIASDEIRLPEDHAFGWYACSQAGLFLAVGTKGFHPQNGDLLEIPAPDFTDGFEKDKKSGAVKIRL